MTARSKVQASAFKERCSAECRASQSSHPKPCLKDEMTLKSRGPIPIYYESLYGT